MKFDAIARVTASWRVTAKLGATTMFGTIFATMLGAPILSMDAATAQEINLPQLLLGDRYDTFSRGEESQIVIRVRDWNSKEGSSKADFCGTGFNFSQLGLSGDGFDFPHAGGRSRSVGFPRTSGSYDFPRPGGNVSYFQLPVGARSPQIIGCLDNQRNILFINIQPPRSQPVSQPGQSPTPPVQPIPQPPVQPQTTSPLDINSSSQQSPFKPGFTPNGQIMMPQQ